MEPQGLMNGLIGLGIPGLNHSCPNCQDQSCDPAVYGLGSSQVCQEASQPRCLWLCIVADRQGHHVDRQCVRLRFSWLTLTAV